MQTSKIKGFIFLSVVLVWAQQISIAQHARIFPQPQSYLLNNSNFHANGILTIHRTQEIEQMLPYFAKQFNAQFGIGLFATSTGETEIQVLPVKNVSAGYYSLKIDTSGILIKCADSEGLFYAMQSVLQQTLNAALIEGVEIEDEPTFQYRGVHLDCARHFFTIPELEQFIDEMARLKFNKFHWHLTDDQGWRIEIKKYPKLTAVGAWRDSTLIGHFSKTPVEYDHVRYGGFYTQTQAKELVRYARARGIEIIPEIEMPGHARAALAAYPELGCLGNGKELGVSGTWGVFDDVFCSKDETISFLKDVLDEIVTIFPSETIHVGGDESPKVRWEVCPACQKQMKDHGLHNEHELQSYVIGQMSEYLSSKGRKLMGWDEILEGGLAENAQVMSWRGTEGGIAAAKAGHNVVMTPTSYCYFDYYQSGSPGEPLAIGGYLPLEKVYSFQPVPKELNESERKYILGGQANLWTEYLPDMNAVYYSAFPRLVAMSEVLWTEDKNRKTYNDFVQGLVKYEFDYLKKKGINFSTACLEPKVVFSGDKNGIKLQAFSTIEGTTASIEMIAEDEVELGGKALNGKAPAKVKMEVVAEFMNADHSEFVLFRNEYNGMPMSLDVHVKDGKEILRTNHYELVSHLALGKEIEFITPPSEKYNVNGSLGLTDGVLGQIPWKGNQWLGFEEDTVSFQLDLGAKTEFSGIYLSVLDDPGSWIYRPVELKIEYSRKGKKWKAADDVMYGQGDSFECKKKLNVRYLRFTVINNEKIPSGFPGAGFTPWTFLDELIITR